jgi:hypothetical protein
MAQDQISTFLAAVLRMSSPSQPNTVTEIRYSSRNSTASDHGLIAGTAETPGQRTGDGLARYTRAAYRAGLHHVVVEVSGREL